MWVTKNVLRVDDVRKWIVCSEAGSSRIAVATGLVVVGVVVVVIAAIIVESGTVGVAVGVGVAVSVDDAATTASSSLGLVASHGQVVRHDAGILIDGVHIWRLGDCVGGNEKDFSSESSGTAERAGAEGII